MHAIVREFSTYMSLAIMSAYIVREFNIFACIFMVCEFACSYDIARAFVCLSA